MQSNFFTASPSVQSSRILYTPSPFARSSLLHLQEVGSLTAIKPHTSKREKLQTYLCFMVEDGESELVNESKRYVLKARDVVFIDCRKAYVHRNFDNEQSRLRERRRDLCQNRSYLHHPLLSLPPVSFIHHPHLPVLPLFIYRRQGHCRLCIHIKVSVPV